MSSAEANDQQVDAGDGDDRPSSPVVTTREEKRKTRMATEGTAFLLAQLRAQAQPQPTTLNVATLSESSGQSSISVENPEKSAQSTSSGFEQSQLMTHSASDEGASNAKKPRLEETAVLVEKTLVIVKERPIIDYDFTRQATLLSTEADCFAESGVDFKFSSKIHFNNYLKGCKWSPNGEWLLTSAEDRKTRTFRLNENARQVRG